MLFVAPLSHADFGTCCDVFTQFRENLRCQFANARGVTAMDQMEKRGLSPIRTAPASGASRRSIGSATPRYSRRPLALKFVPAFTFPIARASWSQRQAGFGL